MKKVLLIGIIICLSQISLSAQSNVYKDRNKCYITAQDFVKKKLSFPKEAKFNSSVVHETQGYGDCTVLGKVTAKNAFGVRTEYVYKIWMSHNGKDWTDLNNWKMIKLVLEDSKTKEQSVIDNRVKPQNDKTIKNAGSIDGITCTIYESNSSATRIITSKKLKESQIKKVPSSLGVKTDLVYFHLPNKKNRGDEYAFKNKDLILIY